MTVSERVVGGVTILDIQGDLTLGEGADRLRDKVRSLLQQDHKHLLVNLASVAYMDPRNCARTRSARAKAPHASGSSSGRHAEAGSTCSSKIHRPKA